MIVLPFGFNKSAVAGLPAPWAAVDVGSPGIAGTSSHAGGVFTLNATGNDLASGSDAFHYIYQPWTGDGVIVARVVSVEDTGNTPMAGVMFRETLAADSRFACLVQRPANLSFRRRTTVGGTPTTSTSGGDTAPTWVRVTRSGNGFTVHRSENGTDWSIIGGEITSVMVSSIYVGLLCSSNETDDVCTSVIDNVSVS